MRKTFQLENRWSVVAYEWEGNPGNYSYDILHDHSSRIYPDEERTGHMITDYEWSNTEYRRVCHRCKQPVPDSVLGFYYLCAWRP